MRRTILFFNSTAKFKWPIIAAALALTAFIGGPANAASCTSTGFVRDTINLTAALINPQNTVSGDVDAAGCNIGVYYAPGAKGKVDKANIHGANYYGIVNNGAQVDITNSYVSDIGETPLNGTQHGVAIYFAFGSNAKGNIQDNTVWNYQKGGIVVNGPLASSNIQRNTVIGQGPVNYIAQNGIQAGYGAQTQIQQNFVSGNSYTGAGGASSGGVIVVGGDCYGGAATTDTHIQDNTAVGNDVGVWFTNLDSSCTGVTTPQTKNTAQNNTLINNGLNNKSGNGPGQGYQAGVSDAGTNDTIQNNFICGPGYEPPGTAAVAVFAIDATPGYANNPKIQNNTICPSPPAMAALAAPLTLKPTTASKAAPVQ